MATRSDAPPVDRLQQAYRTTRQLSLDITAPLSDADATIQPMEEASPAKWHLGHTTWFLETFVLREHLPGFDRHRDEWAPLFNSYYEGEGERMARNRRGMLSRPTLAEIVDWRRAVDDRILAAFPSLSQSALHLVELGLAHEQQHQELMLMDLLAAFAANPLLPSIWGDQPVPMLAEPAPLDWVEGRSGPVSVGHDGAGFAFDCEGPVHRHFLHPHALANRLVTNGEWLSFMSDGGYSNPLLWLSEGWTWAVSNRVEAPLYWSRSDQGWKRFGLDGSKPIDPAEPVCHISHYEADAFARWAGARLPTEFEWEAAAAGADAEGGNQLDRAGAVRPTGAGGWFGDAWCWTGSAFLPYPCFRPLAGAAGEYNGKFMSSQMVLRGGCCATPRGHLRSTYRNFYYPQQRWMFAGLRLAKDLDR